MSSRRPRRLSAIDGISEDDGTAGERLDSRARLSFVNRTPPRSADVEIVTIASGERRPYDERAWQEALVVVERGTIDLECRRGGRRSFSAGDVIWTVGLDLQSLHNGGDEAVVLTVVRRHPRPAG
jgi:hypothetical protein